VGSDRLEEFRMLVKVQYIEKLKYLVNEEFLATNHATSTLDQSSEIVSSGLVLATPNSRKRKFSPGGYISLSSDSDNDELTASGQKHPEEQEYKPNLNPDTTCKAWIDRRLGST
jgi:hypothetical protein